MTVINDDAEYKYKKTEEAQKLTEEENTQFKINFELPYSNSATLKFGAAYKDQSKMRDDVWYEHDMDLGNLNTVPTFGADIESYEPGSKYVIGNFMDARYLGGLTLGGASGANFDFEAEEDGYLHAQNDNDAAADEEVGHNF